MGRKEVIRELADITSPVSTQPTEVETEGVEKRPPTQVDQEILEETTPDRATDARKQQLTQDFKDELANKVASIAREKKYPDLFPPTGETTTGLAEVTKTEFKE